MNAEALALAQSHNVQMEIPTHTGLATNSTNLFGNQNHPPYPSVQLVAVEAQHDQDQSQVHTSVTEGGGVTLSQQVSDIYFKQTEVQTVVNLEQCCMCSTFFEASGRSMPQPDLNRIVIKVLDVTPTATFYKEYLSFCINCTNLLRKFDRLRVELEFVKTQLVTYVIESLTQIRVEGGSQLDELKSQIIQRWTSGQRDNGKRKGKGKEGFSAAGSGGDLSWAAHNNVMNSTPALRPDFAVTSVESTDLECNSDNDNHNGGDDLIHGSDPDDGGNDNELVSESIQEVEEGNVITVPDVTAKVASTPTRKQKKKSKRKREGLRALICPNCGRIFSQRTSFKGHTQVCVSDDLGMTKNCSICSEEQNQSCVFDSWVALQAHVDEHHRFVKLETCCVCRLNFLPNGIKQHTCRKPYSSAVNIEAIFQCDRCDKAYNSRANLVDHVRRLHKDEEHRCEICNKVYGSPMLLSFHVERHKRVISKFKCSHCGVCFTTNYGLKEHLKTHSKERTFECKECGSKFVSLNTLRNHKSVHDSKKPHICYICGLGLKSKSALSRHVIRHQLDETKYTKKCPLCSKVIFRKIYALKRHMANIHPGTAELEEILEKYKDIDDTPKTLKSMDGSMKGKRNRGKPKSGKSFDEDDFDEEESSAESADERSGGVDVKPDIDGDTSFVEGTVPVTDSPQQPSRQSARLLGKSKTKKLVVILTKDSSLNSDC